MTKNLKYDRIGKSFVLNRVLPQREAREMLRPAAFSLPGKFAAQACLLL